MFSKFKKKLTKSAAMSSSFVAVISPIENPVPTGCSTLDGVSVQFRSNKGGSFTREHWSDYGKVSMKSSKWEFQHLLYPWVLIDLWSILSALPEKSTILLEKPFKWAASCGISVAGLKLDDETYQVPHSTKSRSHLPGSQLLVDKRRTTPSTCSLDQLGSNPHRALQYRMARRAEKWLGMLEYN